MSGLPGNTEDSRPAQADRGSRLLSLANEVRQRLTAMSSADCETALATAAAEDDAALLSAVISASPMLSAISKARQETLCATRRKQHYGPERAY
jgi:hypothetical protein